MSALTVDLMGDSPMDEAMIQARAQDIMAATWPAWKRERALRVSGVQLAALNAFMDEISAEVDLARENSALLQSAIDYEAAQARILLPAYDGPLTVETEDGVQPHPDKLKDDAEREAAHEVVYLASPQVLALVASRVPAPEPDPVDEVMAGRP